MHTSDYKISRYVKFFWSFVMVVSVVNYLSLRTFFSTSFKNIFKDKDYRLNTKDEYIAPNDNNEWNAA